MLNAVSEIGTGFVLLIQIFADRRNLIVLLLYWQWLRMRYWAPDSAAIHRNVHPLSSLSSSNISSLGLA